MTLEYLASKSEYPGAQVIIRNAILDPLFDAANKAEVNYLLQQLERRGDIETAGRLEACVVTPAGWARLEAPVGGIPGRCFVAMSFDSALNEIYDLGIRAALVECKFVPVRLDFVQHNEKICDKILAEIRRSQLTIADFTLQRAGVYFEAGFAMGLGRQVIWTCRQDDIDNLHFDTRQYNHVVWTSADNLRERLIDRIQATIRAR
jgi:nucleoside 2-deoxyribosyltransferase